MGWSNPLELASCPWVGSLEDEQNTPVSGRDPESQELSESSGKSLKAGGSALVVEESLGNQLETWHFTWKGMPNWVDRE